MGFVLIVSKYPHAFTPESLNDSLSYVDLYIALVISKEEAMVLFVVAQSRDSMIVLSTILTLLIKSSL